MFRYLRHQLPWLDNGGRRYSKLPLTRTSSSGISFDLTTYETREESLATKISDLWQAQWKLVILVAGGTTLLTLGLVQVLRPASCPNTSEWFLHLANHADQQRGMYLELQPLQPLQAQTIMSQTCADLWIAKNELCQELVVAKTLGNAEVDVVWTFVEPTDHWRAWEQTYRAQLEGYESSSSTEVAHFRSYDEIRYSLRSVYKNMPFARKMTLLATTLPATAPPVNSSVIPDIQDEEWLVAQTPSWLDQGTVKLSPGEGGGDDTSRLEVMSHWELFGAQRADSNAARLPTFNSHAIESQLYRLPHAAESILYLNNDFYIGRPIAPSDLSTHLYGPVFRIYPGSFATGTQDLQKVNGIDGEGNARVMPNTIRLLDARFGTRDRNYLDHTGYMLSAPIMTELAKVWKEEFEETASVRFRGHGPEVWLPLLNTYYIVEKHREALLWSFVVARSDQDASGTYSLAERQDMLDTLAGNVTGDSLAFNTPSRSLEQMQIEDALASGGATPPGETRYIWPSTNGYPYMSSENGSYVFPTLNGEGGQFCSVSISECFGHADFFRAAEASPVPPDALFKRVAFEYPRCGDCLMAGLLSASGEMGFSAFLPLVSDAQETKVDMRKTVPQLGGSQKSWQDVDFSLHSALEGETGTWNKRDFAVRLIQRYAYTFGELLASSTVRTKAHSECASGETPSSFNEMGDDVGWDGWLAWKMGDDSNPFIAINDGVASKNQTILDGVRKVMMDWQDTMFPEPTPYETVS